MELMRINYLLVKSIIIEARVNFLSFKIKTNSKFLINKIINSKKYSNRWRRGLVIYPSEIEWIDPFDLYLQRLLMEPGH